MGLGNCAQQVYLVDFGISQQFRDPGTHAHILPGDHHPLTGTPAFASINSHLGFELSWCDDIESLAYVLIYLLKGSLPWIGVRNWDQILQLKQKTPTSKLCDGIPEGFALILDYSRSLAFSKTPDYTLLQTYIQDIHVTLSDTDHKTVDWQHLPSLEVKPVTSEVSLDRHKSAKPVTSHAAPPHE